MSASMSAKLCASTKTSASGSTVKLLTCNNSCLHISSRQLPRLQSTLERRIRCVARCCLENDGDESKLSKLASISAYALERRSALSAWLKRCCDDTASMASKSMNDRYAYVCACNV